MNENRADYEGKRAKRDELSHFRVAMRRLCLTPWGCQLNVRLTLKNLHHVKQMLHLEPFEHRIRAI